ncbi:MAG: hypothetical protein NZX77_16545, partial [Polyangiaceae bacterium]|nr:hypothetical protein [Polyangiaceae bacterium]
LPVQSVETALATEGNPSAPALKTAAILSAASVAILPVQSVETALATEENPSAPALKIVAPLSAVSAAHPMYVPRDKPNHALSSYPTLVAEILQAAQATDSANPTVSGGIASNQLVSVNA